MADDKLNPYQGQWNNELNRPVTLFESQVYILCSQIPMGRVSTYRLLGKALNCDSSQAIGQALKRNPFAPSPVPCHRVIKTDLDIGGFYGIVNKNHEKILKKKKLLEEEGVVFRENSFQIEERHVYTDFNVSRLVLKKKDEDRKTSGIKSKSKTTLSIKRKTKETKPLKKSKSKITRKK